MFLLLLLYYIERERDIERCWRYYALHLSTSKKNIKVKDAAAATTTKATKEREQQQQQTPKKADGAQLLWVMTFFFL